jgi:hypothetical protein
MSNPVSSDPQADQESLMIASKRNFRNAFFAILAGVALGTLIELPALLVAIASSGAGHGDYVAARALFPLSMLLTLLEGSIGVFSGGLALLQFPLYGALLGWARWRRSYGAVILVASLHLVAAIACFTGILPSFS